MTLWNPVSQTERLGVKAVEIHLTEIQNVRIERSTTVVSD